MKMSKGLETSPNMWYSITTLSPIIINNGSKEDIDKARAELREGIKNMESLAENPFVPEEMRENATAELEKMRKQLELLDSADEIEVESWLMTMVDNGDAVLTDDGGFKVNADYYKELPRDDRHVETMTEVQAVEVMSALTAAGVAYSAATKGEDKVGITVSKADVPALNDVILTQHHQQNNLYLIRQPYLDSR